MSAPLFLVDALPAADSFTLDGPEGHHAASVARLRVGEEVLLSDGRGAIAEAIVTGVGRGTLQLRIHDRRYEQPAEPRLVVVQAIAKGERGELAVQAMTEVGVDVIVPWSATRSIVRWAGERGERSRQRWIDTAREAGKQARRAWLPTVTDAETSGAVATRLARAHTALVLHEMATAALASAEIAATGELVVVVGPEGGVAPEELAAFEAAGAMACRLGPTVLRTSTAGVAALSVLNAKLGRW